MIKVAVLVVAMLGAPALIGCARCPYETQCEGNVLHMCTLGIDQLVGNPELGERTCEAPNPVCVNLDDRHAQCTMTGQSDCTDALVPACGEGTVVRCTSGYQVAEDCAGNGNGCFVVDSAPRCALDPPTVCAAQQYVTHCAQGALISCVEGYETSRNCAYDVAGETCQESSSDAGQTAYCT